MYLKYQKYLCKKIYYWMHFTLNFVLLLYLLLDLVEVELTFYVLLGCLICNNVSCFISCSNILNEIKIMISQVTTVFG